MPVIGQLNTVQDPSASDTKITIAISGKVLQIQAQEMP
jgi:hypothetical protein